MSATLTTHGFDTAKRTRRMACAVAEQLRSRLTTVPDDLAADAAEQVVAYGRWRATGIDHEQALRLTTPPEASRYDRRATARAEVRRAAVLACETLDVVLAVDHQPA